MYYVEPAGIWDSTSTLSVVGIRRCVQSPTPSSTTSGAEDSHLPVDPVALASALKQRAQKKGSPTASRKSFDKAFVRGSRRDIPAGDADMWEAWTLSTTGEFRARPLVPDDLDNVGEVSYEEDLFVAAPGPITRLGKRSIAVGFGNTVKIITLGKESFDGLTNMQSGTMNVGLGSSYKWRARKGNGRKVQ